MIKIKLFYISICLVSSILIVIFMNLFSLNRINDKNGFIRLLPSHKIFEVKHLDIHSNPWSLSGQNRSSLILVNLGNPSKILIVDSNLNDSISKSISELSSKKTYSGFSVYTDSINFYLFNGITPAIFKGETNDFVVDERINTEYFTTAVPLTKSSLIVKYVNSNRENVLAKQITGSKSIKSTSLLKKQIDGIFCTDGEIAKVPGTSNFIYIYYYRNQFLYVDSNLNLLYTGKTIDTNSRAKIKVAKIVSTGETTMSAPPLYVNKRACANSKYLFVQSALKANNETENMIKDVSMVDVYAVSDGKYQFSVYLPDFRGNKVRDFKVYGHSLYALYGHYLYKYRLNF